MLYRVLRIMLLPLVRLFFKMEIKGTEYIPRSGGFILASNHRSYLDPLVLGIACPRKLNFMARHDLFSNPLFSTLIRLLGAFPVRRSFADKAALQEAVRRVRSGNGLVLFPEGTRQEGGAGFGEPQSGIGFLAGKYSIPVIPACIRGSEKALPKKARFVRPAEISVRFGKQILVERRTPYQDAARLIMENIRHLAC